MPLMWCTFCDATDVHLLRCHCCGVHFAMYLSRCHCCGAPLRYTFHDVTVVVYLAVYLSRCHCCGVPFTMSLLWCTFAVYLSRCHCCGVPFTMSLLWCTFAMSPLWCTSVNRTLKDNYCALNNKMGEGELKFCVRGSPLMVCDVNPARVSLNHKIPTGPRSERGWPDGKHEGKEST